MKYFAIVAVGLIAIFIFAICGPPSIPWTEEMVRGASFVSRSDTGLLSIGFSNTGSIAQVLSESGTRRFAVSFTNGQSAIQVRSYSTNTALEKPFSDSLISMATPSKSGRSLEEWLNSAGRRTNEGRDNWQSDATDHTSAPTGSGYIAHA